RMARLALVTATGVAVVLGASVAPAAVDISGPLTATPGPVDSPVSSQTPVARAGLVCPGPEQQGLAEQTVPEVAQDVVVEAATAPRPTMSDVSAAGELEEGEVALHRISGEALDETRERGVVGRAGLEDADGLLIDAREGLAPGLSGAQLYRGDQEQRLALSLTPCRAPLEESWLVAGGEAPGRAERIVLVNPGSGPVDIRLDVLGTHGAADPADGGEAATEIALGAGERQVLLVDALAPGVSGPVVRVTSSPGPVSAYLGDRWLEGSTDAGMQLTAPVAEPATRQVLGGLGDGRGVKQTDSTASETTKTREKDDIDSVTVRAAVPGAQGAVVQLRALTAEGPKRLDADVAVVEGRTTKDITVRGLPHDSYALEVASDQLVVAAAQVRSEASSEGARDLTWAPGLAVLRELGGTPLPQPQGGDGVEYQLALSAPDGGAARVVVEDPEGDLDSSRVDLAAGHSLSQDLAGAAAVWVVPEGGEVYAAVTAQSSLRPRPSDDDVAPVQGGQGQRRRAGPVTLLSVLGVPDLAVTRTVVGLTPEVP
ncbi:MAG: DUF5719 family protein, partial [Ornithinimicrobium sp.]